MNESNIDLAPATWETTTLGSVCASITDGSHNPPPKQVSGKPMLSAVNISGERVVFGGHRLISVSDFEREHRRTQVQAGDVLLTIVGTIGRVAVVCEHSEPFALQRSVAVLKPGELDSRFLMRQLQNPRTNAYLNAHAKGTAQKGVYLGALSETPFLLPPLEEQRRIVDKIEALFTNLDKGEESLREVQNLLARYRQSVLKAAVTGELTADWRAENAHRLEHGRNLLQRILQARRENWKGRGKYNEPVAPDTADLPELPEGWVWASVESLCPAEKHSLKAGPFGSSLKKSDYSESGYKVYGQEQVIADDCNVGEYFIGEEKYQQLKNCKVSPGDVLISLVGTIGKVLVLPDGCKPGIINPRLLKITLDQSAYLPEFFKIYFESDFLKSLYKLDAHGATMDVLNLGIIKRLPFPFCCIAEQAEIAARVNEAFTKIEALGEWCKIEHKRSAALRQSILKEAFSGRLVPQEPNDEPAAELLARLKATRAAKPKKSKTKTKARTKSTA